MLQSWSHRGDKTTNREQAEKSQRIQGEIGEKGILAQFFWALKNPKFKLNQPLKKPLMKMEIMFLKDPDSVTVLLIMFPISYTFKKLSYVSKKF